MLTPEQLKAIPESFVQQLQDLEDFIIADIARRIAKEGGLTDTSVMELNKALGMGTDLNRIERIINQVTDSAIVDIDNVIRDAIDESIAADNVIYKAAGYNPVDLAKSATLTHILEAGIRQTQGDFKNLTRSMGFAVQQANGIVFKPIARFYQDILNQATLRLTTGVMDWKTSTRYAVKEMASSGLRYVDYATGHVNRVDVAARRAILTGTNQLNLRMTDQIMDDLGLEYVETTAHMGARPEHQLWQGQVFHVGGAKGGYPDFVSATGYGTGPGLGGWNCRHSYFAFFPGISTRAYTDEQLRNIDPPPFTYDGKKYTYYEATQRQRELETRIRQTKRELVGYDAAGQKKEFTAASIKLNRQKELYEDFSRAAGIRIKPERHQEYGFGRSVAQKAAQANRKTVEKYAGYRYNKKGNMLITDDKKDVKRYVPKPAYKKNAVVEYKTKKGAICRAIYDENGNLKYRIDNTDHGNPKRHPFGEHGEHIHDIKIENGKIVSGIARELTEKERREHSDIL